MPGEERDSRPNAYTSLLARPRAVIKSSLQSGGSFIANIQLHHRYKIRKFANFLTDLICLQPCQIVTFSDYNI